jgi:dTMP kinase
MSHRFIVVEGLDGSGKTTLARSLADALTRRNIPTLAIKTPPPQLQQSAERVAHDFAVNARFLFHLAGVCHTSSAVHQLLETSSVVCDRYLLSTVAYHDASGRTAAVDIASLDILLPEVTFYVVVEERLRQERIRMRGALTPGDELTLTPGGLLDRIDAAMRRAGTVVIENNGPVGTTVERMIAALEVR